MNGNMLAAGIQVGKPVPIIAVIMLGLFTVTGIRCALRLILEATDANNDGHDDGQSAFGVETTRNGVRQARYAVYLGDGPGDAN